MTKEDFFIDRQEYDEGYYVHLTYAGKGIARMQHGKNANGNFIMNYNTFIPSARRIIDNVEPAMAFLRLLEQKNARNFEQAAKDAGEYFRKTLSKRAFGYRVPSEMGMNIPFDEKEIKKAVQKNSLNFVIMSNEYGAVAIDVCGNRDFSHHKVNAQPETELRIDGFDWNIAEDIKNLILEVGMIDVPREDLPHLSPSLEEMLSHFQQAIVSNPSQPQ